MRHWVVLPFVIACSAASTASTSSVDASVADAHAPSPPPLGGAVVDGGDAASPPVTVGLRVALGTADFGVVDYCVAKHGTAKWNGPLLAPLVVGDAAAAGLSYLQVSAYVQLAPDTYDVRFVPAGSSDCGDQDSGVPTVAEIDSLASLQSASTLVVGPSLQDGGVAARVNLLADDTALFGGTARVRVVDLTADAIDFGLGTSDSKWTALFRSVQPLGASSQAAESEGVPDQAGFLPIPSFSLEPMSARHVSSATDIARGLVTIPAGALATVFVVGSPAALLVCLDNQPTSGALSSCRIE